MDKKSVELEVMKFDLNQLHTSINKTNPKNWGGGGGSKKKNGGGGGGAQKKATVFVLCNTWIFSIHVF